MENLFNQILGMSTDAAWLIGAVIIVRALLVKAPKYFYKILWGLVGLRLLIPFSFESALSLVPEEIPETIDRVTTQVTAAPAEQHLFYIEIVAVIWGTVGLAFLCYGVISYIKLKLKIFDSVIYKENIYYSERIESPFVCGFAQPKIYIPYGLDEETEKCVLQHEKMHIKHGDHILKYLGFAVLCIHWFNPLVWVAYFLLCKDIELACDESVVKNYDSDGCKRYAKALLELGVNKVKLSACPIAFGEVSIKTRIKSVINYKKASRIIIFVSLFLCICVSLCFMTEPEVPLKENVEEVEVTEKTTKPVTEETTKPKTEPTTESVTEPATESNTQPEKESVAQSTVTQYQKPAETTEEIFDDSMFENEEDGLENDSLNRINVQEPDLYDPPNPTSPYEGVSYNNFGSNSSVIGTKPSDTPDFPTVTLFPENLAPTHNYGNTNHPHFEGNQWVYN